MITRPTTDALIADCCRELMEGILPGLTDETLKLRLVMTETVLRNAAVRAAHEIAWMREETTALMAYAGRVAARHGSEPLQAALADAEAGPADSLHLADAEAGPADSHLADAEAGPADSHLADAEAGRADSLHLVDVADVYERAGQAFAAALAAAQQAGDADLVAQARELLRDRIATEKEVMATYAVVGR